MHVLKPAAYTGGNRLLDRLVAAVSPAIITGAPVVSFEAGNIVLDSDEAIQYVFFPIDMMISTTTLMNDGSGIEVGSIGAEGMCGVQLILGVDHVPRRATCQVAGSALRLPAEQGLRLFEQSALVRSIIMRYIQATINALEISIGCNAVHGITARCARSLLLTHDRVQRPQFALTQEFLAAMLGARRGTVNAVAQDLQEQGAIRYARGQVHILDRTILERITCECYQLSIERYNTLLREVPSHCRGGSSHGSLPALPAQATRADKGDVNASPPSMFCSCSRANATVRGLTASRGLTFPLSPGARAKSSAKR